MKARLSDRRFRTTLRIAGALSFAASTLLTGHVAQASTLLGAASSYNAFVFGSFTESGTDAYGRIAVGGDFAPANGGSFTVASQRAIDGAGMYDLVVGGNLTNSGTQMGGGDVFVGGNISWNSLTLPHNVYVNGNFADNGGGSVGGSIYYQGMFNSSATYLSHQQVAATASPIDFLSAQTSLQNVSGNLNGQTANGTVVKSGPNYNLTGTSATLNVFDLNTDFANTTYSGGAINISAPAGSTVVINVAGAADGFSNASINLTGVTTDKVIFNFPQAATLQVSSFAFEGTVLAPYAAFTGNSGHLDGQLIALSAGGQYELHDSLFTGSVPVSGGTSVSPAPEPATWGSFLAAGALLAAARRKLTSRR